MRKISMLAIVLCLGAMTQASAQNYMQTSRAFVQNPQMLGMGDVGVAFGSYENGFFYNPANFAHVGSIRPRINFIGVRASVSPNLFDKIRFFNDRLDPAIDEGLDNLSADELTDLYSEALALGRQQSFINGDVYLPYVVMGLPMGGMGAGLFNQTSVRFRFPDAGGGIPLLDLYGRSDFIAAISGGIGLSQLNISGLSGGMTAKYTLRYLTLKRKPVDALGDEESIRLYRGSSVGFDIGFLYDLDPVPGLRAGLSVYDIIASDFDYDHIGNIAGEGGTQQDFDTELAQVAELPLKPSYRIGLGYELPTLLSGGLLRGSGFGLDYAGYGGAPVKQAFFARLHVGGQLTLARIASVRAGLGQGYTSVGAGISLGFMRMDYAFYGQEGGRIPGQLPAWNHTVQLRFGLY